MASVWTHNQFIDGSAIKGPALGLRIAAGNVPSFVDLATGFYGTADRRCSNSAQTPTLANFATLANVIAGCATRVNADACPQLYIRGHTANRGHSQRHADGGAVDCSVSVVPARKNLRPAEKSHPIRAGKLPSLRPTPFMPHPTFAPSAWVLPLKFAGGGYGAGGKAMFDSEGNLWIADNMQVGSQRQDAFWQGTARKFAPDGKPLSPPLTGFTGGGMQGPGFGVAIDANDNAWITSYAGINHIVFSTRTASRCRRPRAIPSTADSAKCKASS